MRRWLKRIAISLLSIAGLFVAVIATLAWLGSRGYFQKWGAQHGQLQLLKEIPELGDPAQTWVGTHPGRVSDTALELYSLERIWPARLSFSEKEWDGIAPTTVPAVRNIMQADGKIVLRNPKASRSGLSGVVGLDFNWVQGELEFGGRRFTNVAVRYRGNGTYLNSLYGPKQSFKVDLNKNVHGQELAGLDELNFVNSVPDNTYMRDALSEWLFRSLGVAAPRTGYSYLTIDVPGKFTNQALGLYVLIENIDTDFAKDRFGTKNTPIFKPVTYDLFTDLGGEWATYADIYDLKTEATPDQLQRVIEFSTLVSRADDAEFARRLPEYLNLEEFASFVAGHVLLSSCDGFLANGQNYYVYLNPKTDKFGFISWDQDHSFGEFGYVGTAETREQMSIWEPWIYDFLFLKRVMKTEAFRSIYRERMESALANQFTEATLYRKVDELAALLRPAVASESSFRLKRFDQAVSEVWLDGPRDGVPEGPKAPVHQIKRFIRNRIASVRTQLDGKSEGVTLRRMNF